MKTEQKIGRKIREFREFRNISREDLAAKANIDLKQLEYIETKGVVPSLGHLIKLTRALGVRIGTFLDDNDMIGPAITRANEGDAAMSFSSSNEKAREHLTFFSLAQNKPGRHMEPFLVDILSDTASDHKLSAHEGEEFIYVISGEIEINYGKDTYTLTAGDSIYYDSIIAHNVHAARKDPARILAVVYYPI
jgi:transcriptional regulator with XRE-family HTH domain